MDSLSFSEMIGFLENHIYRLVQARQALTDEPLPDYLFQGASRSGEKKAYRTKRPTQPADFSVTATAGVSAPKGIPASLANAPVTTQERPKRKLSEEARRKIAEGQRRRHQQRRENASHAA